MGGLFSAPRPMAPPAAPIATAVAVPASATPQAIATETRVQLRDRSRRGVAGTVATSARGVFLPAASPVTGRKSLLGG